jgi:putative ABC transport system permease protein
LSHAAAPYSLRSGSQATAPRRMRHALMGVEIALAMVVLLGAGLFYRSFNLTHDADPGFRRDGVLLAAYDLSGRPVEPSAARDFAARLLTRLRAVPGVQAAAIGSYVPLDIHGMPSRVFTIDGRRRTDGAPDRALANTITPGYFETMQIPLRRGRDFVDLDDAAAPPQAIVNDEFVRRYVGDAEPIGRSLENDGRRYTITGVVATSRYESFGERPAPMIYFSYRDRPARQGEVHVRAREGGERALAADVRRIVAEMDPALTVYNVRTLGEHIETNLMFRRIPARMFVVLGPLLLVLAAIGIYAVVGYTVSQRTREIGLRLALGATARGVAAQIVGDSLRVIAIGALAGWLIALLAAMDIAAGGPVDVPVFLAVPIVLLLAGACACWLPAHRTSRVDPMVALRHE